MPSLIVPKPFESLPPTAKLLTKGGDTRIIYNAETGANKYNCPPMPDASLLSYGSATASTISPAAFAAAESLRSQLDITAGSDEPSIIYAREMERIRQELRPLLGLSNTDIIFASSGTDVHLLAAQLVSNESPPLILIMEAEETGSGVPIALEGRHFSDTTVFGESVTIDKMLDGAAAPQVITIKSRNHDGSLRPLAEVDNEFETLASRAMAEDRQVLIILTDVSKTGLIIPSRKCVSALHRRFMKQLDILVDACQLRLSPATLRIYLEQGFIVAVTGSKFISGPAFSGALLIPKMVSTRLCSRIFPAAFGQYSLQADWPEGWATRRLLPDSANYGLLLRWQAALTEMKRFYSLPAASVTRFAEDFSAAIQAYFTTHPALEALQVPVPNRTTRNWDSQQTIFPFLLHNPDGSYLNRKKTMSIYQNLRDDYNIELGQPVLCGTRNTTSVSALRLCLSARLIVEAVSPAGRGSKAIIKEALSVLDNTIYLTSF